MEEIVDNIILKLSSFCFLQLTKHPRKPTDCISPNYQCPAPGSPYQVGNDTEEHAGPGFRLHSYHPLPKTARVNRVKGNEVTWV